MPISALQEGQTRDLEEKMKGAEVKNGSREGRGPGGGGVVLPIHETL